MSPIRLWFYSDFFLLETPELSVLVADPAGEIDRLLGSLNELCTFLSSLNFSGFAIFGGAVVVTFLVYAVATFGVTGALILLGVIFGVTLFASFFLKL